MTELLLLLGAIAVAALIAAWAFRQHVREKQLKAALDRDLDSRLQPTQRAEPSATQASTPAPQRSREAEELGSKGAWEQRSLGAKELGSRGAWEQRSLGAEELGSRGDEEQESPLLPASPAPVLPVAGETAPENGEPSPQPVKKARLTAAVVAEQREAEKDRGQTVAPGPAAAASPTRPIARLPEGEPLVRRASEHRGSLFISRSLPPEFERARLDRDLSRIAETRSRNRRIALAAGLVILLLIPVYLFIPPVHRWLNPYVTWVGIRLGVVPPPSPEELAPPPKDLEVSYSNELEAVDGKITINGRVNNISEDKTFDKLFAELTLIKKDSKLTETRVVPVEPSKLAPKEEGRYEITVSASEFIGNRRVRIFSDGTEVPYEYVLPAGALKIQGGAGPIKIEVNVPPGAVSKPEKKP